MADPGMLLAIGDFLAYLLICHVIGTAILLALRLNVRGVVPPSALLGCAMLGIQLWAFGFAHIPWNAFTLLLPWVIVWVVVWRRLRFTLRAQAAAAIAMIRRIGKVEPLTGVLIAASSLLLIVYALNAFLHPVIGWDAVAFWYFKAKLFFVDQRVDPGSPALVSIPHLLVVRNQEYPPLYPLMLASTFVVSGRVNESLSNSINLLGLISVVPTMYSLMRRLLGVRLGVALVFVFVALPAAAPFLIDGTYFGYADYVEACWIVLALVYLQAGEGGDGAADVMAVACAAGAALTKDEGTPLLVFVLALLILRQTWRWRRRRLLPARGQLIMAAACIIPVVIWHFTWTLPGIAPLMLNHHPLTLLPVLPSRAATIGRAVRHLLLARTNTYVWLGLALLMSPVLLAINRFRTGGGLATVFLLQLLAYFTVYLFTPIDLVEHLAESADRVLLQLVPGAIVLFAVSISPYLRVWPRQPSGGSGLV